MILALWISLVEPTPDNLVSPAIPYALGLSAVLDGSFVIFVFGLICLNAVIGPRLCS